jgi:pimeloyl-ACP methyl ester carboxylesterase
MKSGKAVTIGAKRLPGTLEMPIDTAGGLVIFAHGSGSSRLSPRNRQVAARLHERRLATLLFDLLTEDEASDRRKVFDIALLAQRLAEAIAWSGTQQEVSALPCGLFGASTGAAAALLAAVEHPAMVRAVVSRGGRPDLAGAVLPLVRAPTLLIVGGADTEVLQLNRAALALLSCTKRLDVVSNATHLFEEQGALEEVAERAAGWFAVHLQENRDADPR